MTRAETLEAWFEHLNPDLIANLKAGRAWRKPWTYLNGEYSFFYYCSSCKAWHSSALKVVLEARKKVLTVSIEGPNPDGSGYDIERYEAATITPETLQVHFTRHIVKGSREYHAFMLETGRDPLFIYQSRVPETPEARGERLRDLARLELAKIAEVQTTLDAYDEPTRGIEA